MTAANKDERRLSQRERRADRCDIAQAVVAHTQTEVLHDTLRGASADAPGIMLLRKIVLACVLTLCMGGCGLNSFTNGSIPEGKSVVRGRVVAADNAQMPLANVAVTLLSTPTGEMTQTFRVLTDAQGEFSVLGINTGKRAVGTPPTVSSVVVSVDTSKTPYVPQKIAFLLTADRATSVVLAVPPASFDLTQVGSVSVKADTSASPNTSGGNSNGLMRSGTLAFRALLLDRSGNPLVSATTGQPLIPNLALDGLMVDTINVNGLFEASVFPVTANGSTPTSPVGVGQTVSITGSVSLPGAAPSVGTPLSVPIIASPTSVSAIKSQAAPNTPSTPGVSR